MKTTINQYEFVEAFDKMNRGENFSREARFALFDYFEEYERVTEEDIELDVIAICCEYAEYENLKEFNEDYGKECENLDEVAYYTQVIAIPDTERFVIQQF